MNGLGVTIRIPLAWFGLLLFAVSEVPLVIWYYYADPQLQKTILFSASVVGGAFALFAYLKGIEERRSQCADRLIERWNSEPMKACRDLWRQICEGELDLEPLKRHGKRSSLDGDTRARRAQLLAPLLFFEEMALQVRMQSADDEKLRRFFGPMILQGVAASHDWIKSEREADNEKTYFVEIEAIEERWREE